MSVRRLLVLVAASCVVAACSLFTELDGFTTPATAPPDGGVDGQAPSDGAVAEGGDAGDAGRLCQPGAHLLCDDFDDGAPSPLWSEESVEATGKLGVSTARFVSPPSSLRVATERRAATDPLGDVFLSKQLTGFRSVKVDLELFVEAPAWEADDVNAGFVVVFYASTNGDNDGVAMSAGRDYVTIGNPAGGGSGPPIAFGQWVHVRFEITPSAMKVSVGAVVYEKTWPALAPGATPQTSINVGISGYNRPAPPFTAYYDNVVIDAF